MADRILLGRWYRTRGVVPATGLPEVRSPYRFGSYEDTGRPKVVYRARGSSSGCSVASWRAWARRADLMPEGWEPDGVAPFEPPATGSGSTDR